MTVKDLEKSLSRMHAFQDELELEVEERDRMISVLQLTPSSNDNLDLINQLEKILRVMKYFEEDFTKEIKEGLSVEDYEKITSRFNLMVETYASNISQLSDDAYIDVSEYKFHPSEIPMPIALTPSNGIKLVRFKDNLIEEDPVDLAARQQLMNGASHFKPYTDSDDGQGGDSTDTSSIASSFDALSNQQIFAQHQQQILDQDNDLGFLLDSVRRQHQMGLNMNEELDEHIILLNDLESGVDRAYTRLGQAQNRLKNFQKLCKENGSLVTICVLTVILIVLLIVLN